jgi:integrase
VDAYLRYLTAEQRDPGYIQQTRREIAKAAKWCKDGSLDGLDFLDDPEADAKADALLAKMTLADLRVDRLNAFIASSASGRAKTTKNRYRRSLYGMCEHANLRPNPIADVKRLTVKPKDLTRLRRALPPDTLQRLVDVAENRPFREAALIRRGPRKGQVGNLSPGYLAKLARGARQRALFYRLTAALTGLRYGGLCRVKVAFVDLTPGREAGDLPAGILKGGRDYRALIRADLVRVRSRTTTRPCTSCSAGSGTT